MTHRGLYRLSLSALIGAAFTVIMPSHAPAAGPSVRGVVATGFHQVALQGFGDFQNTWPWSGAWYNGRLYIGTDRNTACTQALGATYPPTDTQVTCPPLASALPPTLGAQIWSVDPSSAPVLTQTNWVMNYTSPITAPMTIDHTAVMGPRDYGFRGMSVYTETDGTQALYVSGMGMAGIAPRKRALPPSLLRSTDGVNFQAVPADPGTTMGDINSLTTTNTLPSGMRGQASVHGYFYVTIANGVGNGTVFASATPQLGNNTFQQITPKSMSVYEIESFNNHLYIGVASNSGYQVWRTDCTAPPPGQVSCPQTAFTEVIPAGAGLPNNLSVSVTSMHVFTDSAGIAHLYVGAAVNVATNPGPAEITRVNTDDSWDLVVGTPRIINGVLKNPLSGLGAGFNWPYNMHMWRIADYQGVLYVGTYDASTSALKGTPQQQQYQHLLGFDLFASTDGMHFTPVTLNGFGDMYDEGVRSLVSTPYGLFVGAANHWYGLRLFQGAVSPRALQLAPTGAQAAPLGGGRVALAWEAPRQAMLFHIYRAEARLERVRFPLPLGTASALHERRRFVTRIYWVPGAYHEIATTARPLFVDRAVPAGGHASYYIVAQDAQTRRSAPSTLVSVPLLAPIPTFGRVQTLLAAMGAHGALTARQATVFAGALQGAERRLRGGDIQASRAELQALGRLVLSAAQTATAQRYAEELTSMLSGLSTRETLVGAHVLAAAQLNDTAAGGYLQNAS